MDEEDINIIMRVCVILHNMTVVDERDNYELAFDYKIVDNINPKPIVHCEDDSDILRLFIL